MSASARFCESCGQILSAEKPPAPTAPDRPASAGGGRYRVLRFLGEGGKKRVYLAHDTRLERDVALALIKTAALDEAGLLRVRREARAMGRLDDHPNIVTVLDVIEEGAQTYIVSQYVAGGSVADLLQRTERRRLPIDEAIRIADQVCRALEHAHSRGVIHRDVKPGNVWLTQDGTAKLGDFGLAVALDRSRLTAEGITLGTAAYMAPEQALGRGPDMRSDLYALGAMFYEMVTGRPPFLGDDVVAIISQHLNTPPVAPSWHNPDVPRALEALILRLLAKAPEDRPETAEAVRHALAGVTSAAAVSATRAAEESANPLNRLAAGVFVGREREMDGLRAGLEEALSGRGRLLLLVGEPGIGKTRTAEEFATYARLRKAQVLWGRCYEGEGAPAFWPWVQAIRTYVHDRDPKALLSEMGTGAADIAQVVSEVRQCVPDLPPPPILEPEQARFRLFDSITTFLKNASREQPLVLVLDDLHGADKASLLLLQFLARELRGARLLIIGSYRDAELSRQHPLSQALADLAREQLSERILLRGLTEADVGRFIEITAGLKPHEALVEAVYRETEGNPFFVNEVVRLLVSDGRLQHPEQVKSWSVGLPQSVREVIGRRLERLSERCNRVLTIASVIGREFALDALERLAGLTDDQLLEVMEEAVAARVVVELPRATGRYAFAHALIQETLYEELTTSRRIRLHRQVGEVLEGLYGARPETHLAELAYHFGRVADSGKDVDKAISYATRAGLRATELLAYEEAVGHYDRALQALDLKDAPGQTERCDLLLSLGEAQMGASDTTAARQTFLHAADIARQLGRPEQLARAALGLGAGLQGFWASGAGLVDEALVSLLDESLAGLGSQDSALRALLLGRLAVALYWSPERRAAIPSLVAQAVEMAERVGDQSVKLMTLASRHWADWRPQNLDDRLTIASAIVSLADQLGNREMAILGHAFRLGDVLEMGDIVSADLEIESFVHMAQDMRQPRYTWWAALFRTMRALLVGNYDQAEHMAADALTIGQQFHPSDAAQAFGVHQFTVRREQGGLDDLAIATEALSAEFREVRAWRIGAVLLQAEAGRESAAQELTELAAQGFAELPHDLTWLAGMGMLSETAVLLGDAASAAMLYGLLRPYGDRCVVLGYGLACWGSIARNLGLLATALRRWDDARAHFETALQVNGRMGARPWVAHTQHDYARLLLMRDAPGDRELALQLLARALETAQKLGMRRLADQALAAKLAGQGIGAGDLSASIEAVAGAVQQERPDLRDHAARDGTVTLLFTDIEGFTPMIERLGDLGAQAVLRTHNAIVRQQVATHGGYTVKSLGDGFMLAFPSASRALACAIGVQRAFAAHATEHPNQPIRVRIGIHTGEVIEESNDLFGRAVNVAARIAAHARGSEILVSSLVRELTARGGEFSFDDGSEVELKGLAGTYRVFGLNWRADS